MNELQYSEHVHNFIHFYIPSIAVISYGSFTHLLHLEFIPLSSYMKYNGLMVHIHFVCEIKYHSILAVTLSHCVENINSSQSGHYVLESNHMVLLIQVKRHSILGVTIIFFIFFFSCFLFMLVITLKQAFNS